MLEAEGLGKRFGDVVALDGLSLVVPPGRMVGFLGPNGAGKTTAMRAVMGIAALDDGSLRWEGHAVARADRLGFGYMPEERGLYPGMVVREQLVYLARIHGRSTAEAGAASDELLERLGLAERSGDRVEALSLGNQQRVQLAAALVHEPRLLVLDEPFSGLDPVGVDALGEALAERAGAGVGVLFSSHQLDLVEHICDDVVIVDHGRVVAAGSVGELTTSDRRLVVEVAGDGDGSWLRGVAGVHSFDADGPVLRLALDEGADADRVLDAARAAGQVRHFSFERRRLSEVFRQAVGAEASPRASRADG